MVKIKYEVIPTKKISLLVEDIIRTKDFTLAVLQLHLLLEYSINGIISGLFKKPNIIFDKRDLNFFSNKVDILEALGIIEDKDILYNIRQINAIRNDFAHTLETDKIFKSTKDRIRSMKTLGISIRKNESDYEMEFKLISMETTTELIKLGNNLAEARNKKLKEEIDKIKK